MEAWAPAKAGYRTAEGSPGLQTWLCAVSACLSSSSFQKGCSSKAKMFVHSDSGLGGGRPSLQGQAGNVMLWHEVPSTGGRVRESDLCPRPCDSLTSHLYGLMTQFYISCFLPVEREHYQQQPHSGGKDGVNWVRRRLLQLPALGTLGRLCREGRELEVSFRPSCAAE